MLVFLITRICIGFCMNFMLMLAENRLRGLQNSSTKKGLEYYVCFFIGCKCSKYFHKNVNYLINLRSEGKKMMHVVFF